jgi:hypothetical protein
MVDHSMERRKQNEKEKELNGDPEKVYLHWRFK